MDFHENFKSTLDTTIPVYKLWNIFDEKNIFITNSHFKNKMNNLGNMILNEENNPKIGGNKNQNIDHMENLDEMMNNLALFADKQSSNTFFGLSNLGNTLLYQFIHSGAYQC